VKRWLLAAPALLAAGCASVNPQPSFDATNRRVADQSGLTSVWARTPEQSRELEARLGALLAEPLTAESAAQVALLNNPALQARFEEIGIAQAELAGASAPSGPELEAAAVPPAGGLSEASLTIDVLDVVLIPARRRLGRLELEQVRLNVGDAMLGLAAETRIAFYALQAQLQLADRLALVLEIHRAAAELAERQHAAGNLGDLELENQRAAHQQARVELARARARAREGREILNRSMGLWGPATGWTLAERLPEIPEREASLERLESLALERRLDVAAARVGVDLVGRTLALRKGTRFLPVAVHAGVELDSERGAHRSVGPKLALQLPLFDLGRASIAKLEAQHRQSQRMLEAAAVNARSEVREARDRLVSARDQALFYRDVLLPQRVRILELTLRHYNMMLKGAYELLLARQHQAEAERGYVEAWRDYWMARTELERAVGGRLLAEGEGS
jgi:cobalt-zinc-cadmium efflux system outer membrane protein